ncbi:hypothetical protein [Paraburkholderia elongata]|uniref:Uncharacterized protein n=1 Tax=Paraburkholderia elongata TaxID=2675747 RepID=A0A972SRU8_9BURK|nr:hypothetical protein [Paraburkholderia elongata]NPT61215.1 hypothetical protein [Paraburkholderia elongata]
MKTASVAARFAALAESIELRREGLIGATIYRDSQFELASRGLSPEDVRIARQAFIEAFEQRIVRQWPDDHRAAVARRNLEKWHTNS